MRESSSRAATAAALGAGLAVLVLAGRLLPTTPSVQRPATPTSAGATAWTVRMIPLRDVPTSTVRGVRVPNAIGHTLAQATSMMRAGGLQGVATEHDPQSPTAVVVAQEPPAGVLVPPGSVVGFRTRTDVQANHAPRRLRLPRGPHAKRSGASSEELPVCGQPCSGGDDQEDIRLSPSTMPAQPRDTTLASQARSRVLSERARASIPGRGTDPCR